MVFQEYTIIFPTNNIWLIRIMINISLLFLLCFFSAYSIWIECVKLTQLCLIETEPLYLLEIDAAKPLETPPESG